MSDAAYDGIFGTGFAFTFTPTTGAAFGSLIAQIEEAATPPVDINTDKFTPISGSNYGAEQTVPGRFPVQAYKMKATYCAAEHAAALTCQGAKVKGTLVCTYGDGSIETYLGSLLKTVAAGPNTATGLRTDELTFEVPVAPADLTFNPGSGVPIQTTLSFTTSGTIDLTASPFSATGKAPIRFYLMAPANNTNPVTIAKGASSGYTGFGSTFATTLAAGQTATLSSAVLVASGVKSLDVTCTGTQALVVLPLFQ